MIAALDVLMPTDNRPLPEPALVFDSRISQMSLEGISPDVVLAHK